MGSELRKLISRQNDLKSELSKVLDGASDKLTEEQEKRCKDLKDSIVSLGSQIEYRSLADEAERAQGAVDGEKQEFRHFSISRAIQSMIDGGKTDAGFEREVTQEMEHRGCVRKHENSFLIPREIFYERRAVSTANASAMIATDLRADQFVDAIWEASPLSKLPVRRLSGLVGNVSIPKASSVASVGWFTEGNSIAESGKSFESINLSPCYIGGLATVSLAMIRQSSKDIDKLLVDDFSKAVALAEAEAFINGSGEAGQPKGLLHADNAVEAIETNAEPMMWAVDCMASLFEDNVQNVSFLVNSKKFADCEGQLSTDKQPIPASVFWRGRPYAYFSKMPEAKVLCAGDFSEAILASWGGIEILANPYSQFSTGAVQVRLIDAVNFAFRHTEAFRTLGGE